MYAEEVEMCYGLYHKEETELMTSFSKPLSSWTHLSELTFHSHMIVVQKKPHTNK